jgi:hypothetical protein
MSSLVWWVSGVSPILVLAVLLKAKTVRRLRGDGLHGWSKDWSDYLEFDETADDHLPNVIRGRWLI